MCIYIYIYMYITCLSVLSIYLSRYDDGIHDECVEQARPGRGRCPRPPGEYWHHHWPLNG